jgi:glycine hydroxymethyltransferase
VPYADVIMLTTHKTFRGPRGAVILVTDKGLERNPDLGAKVDKAIIPGLQGGPHNATTAGIAIAAQEATRPEFQTYARQVRKNADVLAETLMNAGVELMGDGTENHLMVVDLTTYSEGLGSQVAFAMDVAGIYANRNAIPNEPCSPFYPSGLRIGTPLITTRGMKEAEAEKIGQWIVRVIEHVKNETLPAERKARGPFVRAFKQKIVDDPYLLEIKQEVKEMAAQFPLFTWD